MNCAAIPADIVEAELFGHLKGAFTGADSAREGLFLFAQGGTLFLDEVGDFPCRCRASCCAFWKSRVRPVGAEREAPVDVRVIVATNIDLQQVAAGRFRPTCTTG